MKLHFWEKYAKNFQINRRCKLLSTLCDNVLPVLLPLKVMVL
jgi:hypothetical protein